MSACDNVTNEDYNPHAHPATGATPWFEGWYVRISDAIGASSFAVGIGHFPDQNLSGPSAACFLLSSPRAGQPLQLYSRTFNSLSVRFPIPGQFSAETTPDETASRTAAAVAAGPKDEVNMAGLVGGPTPLRTTAGSSSCSTDRQSCGSSSSSDAGGRSRPPSDGSGAARRAEKRPLGFALTAIDNDSGDFCNWTVTSGSVDIHARLAGASLQLRSEAGACAAASPWGGPSAPSPEGWLARVGFLLRLRYDVLSLRTPVQYVFRTGQSDDTGYSDGNDDSNDGDDGNSDGDAGDGGSAPGAALDTGPMMAVTRATGWADGSSGAAAWGRSLIGRGSVSADGVSGAGGNAGSKYEQRQQPVGRSPLWRAGLLHVEKNWGQSFPDQWVWAQGHRSTTGQQASFVIAGGLLPHIFEPYIPTLRQFVFSYHPPPPAAPFTLDPRNPPLFNSLLVQGCDGIFSVDLYGAMHVVQLVAAAPPSTFQALPCPTSSGFRNYSVESFSARVTMRVLRRPYPFAPASSAAVLLEDTFEDAAMEFGGAYMCPEHMPQLKGTAEEVSPLRGG